MRSTFPSWIRRFGQAGIGGAEALNPPTATYYIVVELTASPAERTHWAMVYGSKALGGQRNGVME